VTGLDEMLAWSYLNADNIGRRLLGSLGWVNGPRSCSIYAACLVGESCDLVPAVELLPQHAQHAQGRLQVPPSPPPAACGRLHARGESNPSLAETFVCSSGTKVAWIGCVSEVIAYSSLTASPLPTLQFDDNPSETDANAG
jgi:hypothetical protein